MTVRPDFQTNLTTAAEELDQTLRRLLPQVQDVEARLFEAMRYSVLNGGKRLRPFLVLASAGLFSVDRDRALRVAAAIELIHCYSLVHDDLPAMDDDDLRRGKPTTHKQFDEATAILVGDGLQSLAFEILAHEDTHSDAQVRCALVLALSRAAGCHGMVGGQMLDILAEDETFDQATTTRLQRLKTGALFAFSCEAGAILGRSDPARRLALRNYAHDMGLAFQIADDILDVEGSEAVVGKKVGKDQSANKSTFVSLLGLDRAKTQAEMLSTQAIRHLKPFDERADDLRDVARFVIDRQS